MNTLIMPFIDESSSFTCGFECGMIWNRVASGECFEGVLIHEKNIEQIKMICETFGADYEITGFCDGWAHLAIKQTEITI